jgi:hypothetical protein
MQRKIATQGMITPQIKLRTGIVGGQSTTGTSNGGTWYNGVFYPDYSGSCSTAQPPTNQPGTWYGGVFYPDYSGTCTSQTTTSG